VKSTASSQSSLITISTLFLAEAVNKKKHAVTKKQIKQHLFQHNGHKETESETAWLLTVLSAMKDKMQNKTL